VNNHSGRHCCRAQASQRDGGYRVVALPDRSTAPSRPGAAGAALR
jgi:hypothetical protein